MHNRFQGQGLLRWTARDTDPATAPLLRVRDKGRLPARQAVTWAVPGDDIAMLDRPAHHASEFGAHVAEARHLGEITLATLRLTDVPGAQLLLTVSGPERRRITVEAGLAVRIELDRVHVMPLRSR